ncbi:acyltransferase family protein [Actinomadura rubrobrunea]|nr:acyltransferase [Actinomadura rubrobrunea]
MAPALASSTPAAQGRLRVLDLLRFVAASAVMLFHFTGVADRRQWGQDPRELFPELWFTRFGQYGVDLFFIISGFVILMSVWGRTPGDFAVSRVSRLFPAYWFSVAFALAVFAATGLYAEYGPGTENMWQRFLPNLTMLQRGAGVSHMEGLYWTLWVELHFYALIALLVWRGVTYNRCVAFMIGWLLLGLYAQEGDSQLLKALLIPDWAPNFIAGMAFFLIYAYGSNIVPWLLVAASWALATAYWPRHIERWLYWHGVHEYVSPAVITAIFLTMALVATHRLDWIRWRRLTVLGALTYPLYLVHLTVLRPVTHYLYPQYGRWQVLAIAVAVALLLAYLVYRLVEQPGQRWLRTRLRTALTQIRSVRQPASR